MAIQARERGWLARKSATGIGVIAVLAFASGALAQEKKAAEEQLPARLALPVAPVTEQLAWVKLCEKGPVTNQKDGKDVREEKTICLTNHHRLDGNTGLTLISAGVRQIEGEDKQYLLITIGREAFLDVQSGLRATIYNTGDWAVLQRNEKVDDAMFVSKTLPFKFCHRDGCTAEIELDSTFRDQLKSNAGLMIFSTGKDGQVSAIPVPLTGFGQALDGAPMDTTIYEGNKALYEEFKKRIAADAAKGSKAGAPAPAAEKKK